MVDFSLKDKYNVQDLVDIVKVLRAPGGCQWDAQQTHESIRRNFLEEAYEVAEAIDQQSTEHLQEELGDVLLQVVFHTSIEEEEGSEASAKEINEITALVKEYNLPVIFTEVNGSDATANAISRETGCAVAQLTMLMDGPDGGTLSDDYCGGLMENIRVIVNSFAGEEVLA